MKKLLFLALLFSVLMAETALAQQNKKPSNKTPVTPNTTTTTKPVKQPGNNGWIDDSLLWVKNPGNGKVNNTPAGNNSRTNPSANRTTQPVKNPGQINYNPYDSIDMGRYRKSGNQGSGSTGTVPVKKTGTRNN